MSQLINVDFRKGVIINRVDLGTTAEDKPKFEPLQDPFFKEYVKSQATFVKDAVQELGARSDRMVTLLHDPSVGCARAIWDTDAQTLDDVIAGMQTMTAKLIMIKAEIEASPQ